MITGTQRQLVETITDDGRVESRELEALRSAFGDGSTLSRDEADLLAELFKRVPRKNPAFQDYFYKIIKNYVRSRAPSDADLMAWLRRLLLVDGVWGERQRQVLRELRGEMENPSAESRLSSTSAHGAIE